MRHIIYIIPALLLLLSSCSCSSDGNQRKFIKNPVDILMRDLSSYNNYSIILHDMDMNGSKYQHQYKVVQMKTKESAPEEKLTKWYEVDRTFFNKHQQNMGMEIASKSPTGKISKVASPPGYSNYVGNEQYGRWKTDNSGNSFWEFYGKYAMMQSMFNMMSYPIYRSHYNDYHSNYYGRRAYYGPRSSSGSYRYGTSGSYTTSTRPKSKWGSKTRSTSGFGKSSSSSSSSSRSSSSSFGSKTKSSSGFGSSSSRSSHSSSRYSSSSYRSRSSGGFGK